MDSVGIVGVGSVGRGLSKVISHSSARLYLYDIDRRRCLSAARPFGAECLDSLEEMAAMSEYVIVATPPGPARALLERLARQVGRVRIVSDALTYKEPVKPVYKAFGSRPAPVGIHPLFSSRIGVLRSHTMVVIPVEGFEDEAREVEGFFARLGLRVVELGLEEHDAEVARTIGLSYAIASIAWQVIKSTGGPSNLASTTYSMLQDLAMAVASDSCSLVNEIMSHPEAKRIAGLVASAAAELAEGEVYACGETAPEAAYRGIYCYVESCRRKGAAERGPSPDTVLGKE